MYQSIFHYCFQDLDRSKGELLRGKFGGTRNAGLEGTVDIQLTQLQGQFTCLSSFFSRHSSRSRNS